MTDMDGTESFLVSGARAIGEGFWVNPMYAESQYRGKLLEHLDDNVAAILEPFSQCQFTLYMSLPHQSSIHCTALVLLLSSPVPHLSPPSHHLITLVSDSVPKAPQ